MTTIEPQPIAPWDPAPLDSGESGSVSPPPGDPLIPADLGGWFTAVISAVRRSWARLAALQLIVVAVSVVFAGTSSRVLGPLVAAGPGQPGSAPGATPALPVASPSLLLAYVPIAALSFVVVVVIEAAAVFVVLREAAGRPAGVAAAVRFGLSRMFPLLGWQVVAGLVLIPAFLLLLLPGIYVAIVVGGGLLGAVVVERRGLGRTFTLVNRRLWPTAGRLALAGVILGAYYVAVRLVVGAIGADGDGPLSMSTMIVQGLLQLPAAVVGSAVVVVTYAELRWRERPSAVTTGALAEEMDSHDSPRLRVVATVLLALLALAALILPAKIAPATPEASAPVRGVSAHPKVIGTAMPAGKQPQSLTLSPNGRYGFVIHNGTGAQAADVTVFDMATGAPSAVFPVGGFAWAVAVTPDGRHAYVSDLGSKSDGHTVGVLDAGGSAVSARIEVGPGPLGMAVTPDGRRVYVAISGAVNEATGQVAVIDTATNQVSEKITVGADPYGVTISRDGRFAYVPAHGTDDRPGNTVTVIDTSTNLVTRTITVQPWPVGTALTPDGRKLYVTHSGPEAAVGSTVTVVDTTTGVETATMPVGVSPANVQVTPDGRYAYVVNTGLESAAGDTVSVIDTATDTPTDTVVVGQGAGGLAISPDGGRAYVANFGAGTISTIDTGTGGI